MKGTQRLNEQFGWARSLATAIWSARAACVVSGPTGVSAIADVDKDEM